RLVERAVETRPAVPARAEHDRLRRGRGVGGEHLVDVDEVRFLGGRPGAIRHASSLANPSSYAKGCRTRPPLLPRVGALLPRGGPRRPLPLASVSRSPARAGTARRSPPTGTPDGRRAPARSARAARRAGSARVPR